MKVLLVGNRAIQHALEQRLRHEGLEVHVYPGQRFGGYACVDKEEASESLYDLVVVGSPRYIDDPVVKSQKARGAKIFGPDHKSFELESSKNIFKQFAETYGIPTPPSRTFEDYAAALEYVKTCSPPFVIKADGPARGCGVSISGSLDEAGADLDRKLRNRNNLYYSGKVVIEEYAPGFEVAINILISPSGYLVLPPTRPHKRRDIGDTGQIVAGMGSFASVNLNQAFYDELHSDVLEPTLRGMRAEGRMFTGCLFVNLMVSEAGITVLEFNCRMGDPAMLTSLMLLRSPLSALLSATVEDRLAESSVVLHQGVAIAVTLVDPAYPDGNLANKRVRSPKQDWLTGDKSAGLVIAGAELDDIDDASLAMTNGVVACAVSRGEDFSAARAAAYKIAQGYSDLYYRTDIGNQVAPPHRYLHASTEERSGLHSFRPV